MVGLGAATFTMLTLEGLCDRSPSRDTESPGSAQRHSRSIRRHRLPWRRTIIQSRGSVKGVTTAATIWVVGAYGVACGLGDYFLATSSALLALLTLSVMGMLERRLMSGSAELSGEADDLPANSPGPKGDDTD